jgi:hypothetical protein
MAFNQMLLIFAILTPGLHDIFEFLYNILSSKIFDNFSFLNLILDLPFPSFEAIAGHFYCNIGFKSAEVVIIIFQFLENASHQIKFELLNGIKHVTFLNISHFVKMGSDWKFASYFRRYQHLFWNFCGNDSE